MRVRVLYFGVLKDVLGRGREERDVAEGSTVGKLLEELGAGAPVWRALAVAVNREYAPASTLLREGDEVALLPPVSGGRGAY